MDFEEWFESRDDIGCIIGLEGYAAEEAWNARQAEIDALQQQNQRLAMRLDVIQGVLQKQIDLIVELKNDT